MTSSVPTAAETPGVPSVQEHEELERLRAEVAGLRQELQTRERRRRGPSGRQVRGVIAAIVAAVAAFALVLSVVGLWAARTSLSTDRWVSTVAPLPQDPQISAAVAEYATAQTFTVIDVEGRLREVLPPQAAFAAGPVAGQLRTQIRNVVTNVLRSDGFQTVWIEVNRRVHNRLMAVVEGDSTVINAQSDHIDIDLLPLINQALREISAQLPTLFGRTVTLPDLSSGAIPGNLRVRVQDALGVTLPANFAQFTVYDGGQLKALQDTVAASKRYLALFVAATVVLVLAAFAISPRRRRTAVQLGIWLVVAALTVTVIVRAVRRQAVEQVPEGVYRDGVNAAVDSVFAVLRERGTQLIWVGAVLAVIAYLAGPGRFAVWLRRSVVSGTRWAVRRSRTAYKPGFVARHLDPIRIGGLVVAGVAVLIGTSWTSLLVTVVLLAAYEVAVTLIAKREQRGQELKAA
ncbi:hypothetical protein AB0J83_18135 [Actinoplanes sp. NPDC049596]|uniref:hypothetical protein n=1 Tax=unclassified Actinoplanes TaxID=2626549 RepID=UPI00342FD42C